jgi:hypothetical protein
MLMFVFDLYVVLFNKKSAHLRESIDEVTQKRS